MRYAWRACRWALLCLGLVVGAQRAKAQDIKLYDNEVVPMNVFQGINLRVNAVDLVALTPNLGVEFTLGAHNWNKWTLGFYGRANWKTTTHMNTYNVYDLYDGRGELRKYWHGRNPRRVFYMGVYGGVEKFDIKFTATGKKGNGFIGGLTVGTILPLYGYKNGSSLDLELGLNAGVLLAKYDEYERQRDAEGNESYVVTKPREGYKIAFDPLVYAVTNDVLKVSFIYHFGPRIANRYKKRVNIDDDYRYAVNQRIHRRDSLRNEHRLRRDTLRAERKQRKQQRMVERIQRKRERAALREQRRQQRMETKAARKEEKAAKKKGGNK